MVDHPIDRELTAATLFQECQIGIVQVDPVGRCLEFLKPHEHGLTTNPSIVVVLWVCSPAHIESEDATVFCIKVFTFPIQKGFTGFEVNLLRNVNEGHDDSFFGKRYGTS